MDKVIIYDSDKMAHSSEIIYALLNQYQGPLTFVFDLERDARRVLFHFSSSLRRISRNDQIQEWETSAVWRFAYDSLSKRPPETSLDQCTRTYCSIYLQKSILNPSIYINIPFNETAKELFLNLHFVLSQDDIKFIALTRQLRKDHRDHFEAYDFLLRRLLIVKT